jgi:adenosine deaminase
MCISSNVHTGAVPAAPEHPFRKYLESGVIVSLNTDSRLMDGVTLTNEYHLAHVALGVSKAQLAQTVLHAAESAFLQESEKVALTSRLKSELEGLG